jgi:probable cytoplasmic protein
LNIGRVIVEKQGGNNKAEYGAALIKNLSKK